MPPFPLCYFMTARLPAGAHIVTFPGGPNPDDVMVGRWNKRVPPFPTRWQHLHGHLQRPARGRQPLAPPAALRAAGAVDRGRVA